jgi:hypothetical protein
MKFVWDAICYRDTTWAGAAVSVAFEWGVLALLALCFWILS